MSILKPLWGSDISDNNPNVSLKRLEAEDNHEFCILRVTGGYGGGRDVYMDRDYRARHRELKRRNMIPGVYGFPIDPNVVDMDKQLDRFLNGVIGGFDGKLVCVDYELYEPSHAMTCTPSGLKAYVRGIRKAIGPTHPIGIYAGLSFWNEAPYTGDLDSIDRHLWQWVPKYRTISPVRAYKKHYRRYLPVMGWWRRFARRDDRKKPEMIQPMIGVAGGGPVDIDAFRGTRDHLRALARG